MILFFKIDDMERMYLLYSTELVTREDKGMAMNIIPESIIPSTDKQVYVMTDRKNRKTSRLSVPRDTKEECARCNLTFDRNILYQIPYKYLLDPIDYNMLATQEQKRSKFWFYPKKNYKQILPIKKQRQEDYIAFPPVK